MKTKTILAAALVCALAIATATAQTAPKMNMTTDIPPEITTPDSIETRLGTPRLFDGFPDDATTQKVYDNLDFQRGVQVFLNTMPGAAVTAFRPALQKLGGVDGNFVLFEELTNGFKGTGCDPKAGQSGGLSHPRRMSHLASNRHHHLSGKRRPAGARPTDGWP